MCGTEIERISPTAPIPAPQSAQPTTTYAPPNTTPFQGSSRPTHTTPYQGSSTPSYGAPSYSSSSYSGYKRAGDVDSHSRMALTFGLLSCILMFVGFIIGGAGMGAGSTYYDSYYGDYIYTNPFILVAIPLSLIFNIAGLVFGIVGRVQANKAGTINSAEKWGGIMAVLGIIFNAIGLALVLLVGPIAVGNLYSNPYYY